MRAASAFRAAGITFGALAGLVFSLVILEPAICRAEAAAAQPPAQPAANGKVDQARKIHSGQTTIPTVPGLAESK